MFQIPSNFLILILRAQFYLLSTYLGILYIFSDMRIWEYKSDFPESNKGDSDIEGNEG
jgi:hypothetical protein